MPWVGHALACQPAANIGQEVFDGPHGFSGKLGMPFLAKHLA